MNTLEKDEYLSLSPSFGNYFSRCLQRVANDNKESLYEDRWNGIEDGVDERISNHISRCLLMIDSKIDYQ